MIFKYAFLWFILVAGKGFPFSKPNILAPKTFSFLEPFTPQEQAIIHSAKDTWNLFLPPRSRLKVGFVSDFTIAKTYTHAGSTTTTIVIEDNTVVIRSIRILVSADLCTTQLFNVVLHEFGHALGMSHNRIRGSIMNYSLPHHCNRTVRFNLHPSDVNFIYVHYWQISRT